MNDNDFEKENTRDSEIWSDERYEKELQSKKEKEQKLKPGQEEVYLLLIALLLIASGPIGIAVASGLIGGYGLVKAADLKRYVDKAKKIKKQRMLGEERMTKADDVNNEKEEKDQDHENMKKSDLSSDKSVAEDFLKNPALEELKRLDDSFENKDDLIEALSYVDYNVLDRISEMSEEKIKSLAENLAKEGNSRKDLEKILQIKKDLASTTTEQNIVNPENQLVAKSLEAQLNKLIENADQPNNSLIPNGPSTIDITPSETDQRKTITDTNQVGGLFPPSDKDRSQSDLERHSIQLSSDENNMYVSTANSELNNSLKSETFNPYDQFKVAQNVLNPAGESFRQKESMRSLLKNKSEINKSAIKKPKRNRN